MVSQNKNSLTKTERLCGTKRIDALFSSGESFIVYPLRLVYTIHNNASESNLAMMVSVSKKRLKRAVKRNKIKRLIRETFRLNKQSFTNICVHHEINMDIAFLYLKKELTDYQEIEKAIIKSASILSERMNDKKQKDE